jgi:hypothetical protein
MCPLALLLKLCVELALTATTMLAMSYPQGMQRTRDAPCALMSYATFVRALVA